MKDGVFGSQWPHDTGTNDMMQTLEKTHSQLCKIAGDLSLAITKRKVTKRQLIDLRHRLNWAHGQIDHLLKRMV